MSKPFIKIILSLVMILLFIAMAKLILPSNHFERVVPLNGIRFGMSPVEVCSQFGFPEKLQQSSLAPEVTYTFLSEYCGYPATINATFVRSGLHYMLYSANIHIDIPSEEQSKMFNSLIEECQLEYRSTDTYREKIGADSAEFELSYGPVLLGCTVKKGQSSIEIGVVRAW